MSRSPEIEDPSKMIHGVKFKNLNQMLPQIPMRKNRIFCSFFLSFKGLKLENSDAETPSVRVNSKKIYVPHNRLPALHKIKTHTSKKPFEFPSEKVSHLLKTFIQRQKQKALNMSLDSENKDENNEIPLNRHLIEEFFATKAIIPLKTECSPFNIRNKSSDSQKDENNEIAIFDSNLKINNNNHTVINNKDKDTTESPAFCCLNIKRLVTNMKKFNSPVLLQKTSEKKQRKQDENTLILKTEETCEITNKLKKSHKRKSFVDRMQKTIEISPYQRYELFIRCVNFSNNFSVNISKNFNCYKAFIGKGNNRSLVKTLIKNRWWWSVVDSIEENPNFVWTQIKSKSFLEILTKPQKEDISDDEENQQESSLNKGILTTTTISSLDNLKSLLPQEDIPLLRKGWKSLKTLKKKEESTLTIKKPIELKIHNHFENNFHLGNKKALFYNLREYYEKTNQNVFQDIPTTFHIRKGLEDPEYSNFLNCFYEMKEKTGQKLWILKPGERSNRGKGIDICDDLNQIKQIISSKSMHKNGKIKTYILQSYIENPLLYNKRKFDIRCYVLVTNFNRNLKAFWYKEGYIRTSSKDFSLKNLGNKLIHLTNDAIQKKSDDYGKFEPSNKVSFDEFQKYMKQTYPEKKFDFGKDIHDNMKEKAKNAMRAAFGKINKGVDLNQNSMIFEVFGLDFMIDEDLKVWLIEINTNPCLELSSPLLGKIISNMLENAFRLSLDCLFPAPFLINPSKYQRIANYFESNKFELIFDEFSEGQSLNDLTTTSKFNQNNDRYTVNLDDEDSDDQTDQQPN